MKVTKNEVLGFLPHKRPFLFVDHVEEIFIPENAKNLTDIDDLDIKNYLGAKVKAHFFVDPDLDILKGHFPGNPILPGVVQIEMMAQASVFIFYKILKEVSHQIEIPPTVALLGVDHSRFKKPIIPNMHLTIETELIGYRSWLTTYEGRITVDGQLVSNAQFMASIKFTKKI